ncbi:MAG: DUF4384 domain-containing protein [Syntrophales bacterium]|nr:DUF4384 domain-containing protein [Syntrophales bacterium]
MKRALFIMALLLLPLTAFAEKPVWIEADGEAYLSEVETPKEVMERAKRDAATNALAQARGVFLRSHTLVSNSQLEEDLIYAAVRGRIDKIKILHGDWQKENRNLYQVRIKALVSPVYPEKGEGLSVKLSLSKTGLREGDEVRVQYQANRDAYAYLFSVAADGSVTLLYPNSGQRDNKILGKRAYEFPSGDSPVRLTAMFLPNFKGKMAEEKVKLIVTKAKEDLLPLGFQEGMFQAYDAGSTGMISDLVRKLNQIDPADWAEATAGYTIKR